MSSEELHLKRWFKFSKIHKTIPPIGLFKDNTAANESICYSLYITQITNIQNKSQADLSIRILINLFNTETKEYFGRTYESPFLDLRESEETQGVYIHDPIIAYFHLKHSIPCPVNVVIEVVQFEKKEDVIISRQILGWTLIPLLAAQNQKLTLKRGSSRFLISQQTNFDTTLYSLCLDLDENKEFNEIKFLFAEGCVCGIGDEVIGLQQGNIRTMKLLPSQTAFITSIKLMVPVQMELIISENLKKYKELKFRDSSSADVTFVAKRLVTAFHNGWTFTNSRGLNNFITLEEGPIVQMPVDNQKVDYKKLTFSGALDVNNVFTESNLGVFVIQLEYDVEFMVVNMGRQRSTIICGWVPIVPTEDFDEELIVGPGTALNGKALIDLSDVLCPLSLTGKVNYGGIGVGIANNNQSSVNNVSKAQLPDVITNEKKAEYLDDKTKLKMLENTLKSLQQERQLSSTHVAMDFENKLKMDRQKEEEYQKMVDSIKKQHEEEIMQITGQYEELKRMMSDINQTQQQYLTKTQPQASMAMMQQSVLYDQQTLEKWKIVESMTSVPRKTFYKTQQQLLVEASYGTKTLSRADLAFLSQNGIRELFQYTAEVTDNDDLKQRSLQYELQDHRQMSLIQIQLLSFKPRITQTSDNLEPQNNYYSEEGRIPQRVELRINFFDNPIYETETLLFENGFDKNSFQNCLQQQIPFLFIREYFLKTGESHKEPVFQFTMDPVVMNYPNAYKYYCQYLYNKCMTMELWDSDSRMLYGTIKIPMRALMRQNQDAAFIMKKADIVSPDFKNVKGEIQLLVKNIGREPRESEKLDKNNHVKRKVISTKQLEVKSFVERKDEEINLISNDPDERIKERIRRFKNDTLKTVSLVEINRFKEVKKNAFVRSVIQGHLSEEKVIYPLYGRLELVPLEFQNPFGSGQNFVIVVDDQELKCSGVSEIQVIYQAVEWKYFVDTENYPKPPEFNMIQMNNGQLAMFLQAKENVTLLVKYLTVREVDTSFKELQKTEDLSLQKGNPYLLKYSYPRQVAIYINTTEGQCVGGLRVKIYPKSNSTDHIYNFYERDNRQVSLLLPAIYGYSVPTPDKRPKLYVTDKQVMCEWANDFEIRVSLRIGEVNKITTFNILCYQDTYYRELLANWQINIFSLAGLGLEVPLGQVQINKLTVHVDLSKQVRFYSSHPLLVWFPQPYDGIVSLLPGKINIINISVRIFIEQIYKVMVTCVDVNSRELIRSWILTIAPTVPPVSQVFDVTCPLAAERNVIVPYQNKLNSEVWMIFVSSNEQILQPLEKRINYKPQQSQNLKLKIFRVGEMLTAEVKLFIGDEDRSRDTYDCILFRITYN